MTMYYPRQAVEGGPELERILALPRRTKPPAGAEDLSSVLRAPHGKQVLRPVQAQALAEIHCLRGLLGAIRVGGGKTLITYLAPTMVGATRPVLLLPAKLRAKTLRDFEELGRHWSAGAVPKILSYEKLGHPGGADDLQALEPDMIIADEVHRLKNLRAACTRRVGRYLEGREGVVFVGLSGTVTSRSLLDFAHLAEWALGQGAPVPLVLVRARAVGSRPGRG